MPSWLNWTEHHVADVEVVSSSLAGCTRDVLVGSHSGNCTDLESRRVFPTQVRVLYPPPVGKSEVWLALCEGSPADFRRKIEFFVFVLRSKTPEAGFSEF